MSNTTDDSGVILRLQSITNIIYAYFDLVIFIIGTIGNFCNIRVFTHLRPLMLLASSWFLLASFIGSQFVLSTAVISRVILGFSGVDPVVSSFIWCKIRWVLGPASGSTALYSISLAAIERYFVSSRQINRHRWITRRRAGYILLILIFVCFIAFIGNIIFYTSPSCTIANPIYALFNSIFGVITYSIGPLVLLAVFCTLTWFNIQSVQARILRKSRVEHQVNAMMLAQICVVLITSVPNATLLLYTAITRTTVKTPLRRAQEQLLSAALSMLGFTTYAGTFYVYYIASRSYRKNVQAVIFRREDRSNQVFPTTA